MAEPHSSAVPPVTGLVFMKLESERVPRKNLRSVGGRPLFTWIFDALDASGFIEEVILNTDSELIADVADHLGCRHRAPAAFGLEREPLQALGQVPAIFRVEEGFHGSPEVQRCAQQGPICL